MLTGGVKINVIPSEAEAILDIRALPDENMDKFKEEMAKVIGDPTVRIVPEGVQSAPSPASSLDTQLFRTLDAVHKQMFPGTPILPSMSTGATDMRYLRAKGVQSYGIGPVVDEEDATGHAMHSDNERIRETSLYSFVKYVHEIVSRMAVSH
jgi:acetylornithine deacetylase/succinyl-diaminopimelate desuccinylase-like protein